MSSRGAAFAFRGDAVDVTEVGRLLGVQTVLLGSVLNVSVGKLFAAALAPGLLLVIAYVLYHTGVGIPEPDRERIFRPFFSTKAGGTGLGLAVSVVQDPDGTEPEAGQTAPPGPPDPVLPARPDGTSGPPAADGSQPTPVEPTPPPSAFPSSSVDRSS